MKNLERKAHTGLLDPAEAIQNEATGTKSPPEGQRSMGRMSALCPYCRYGFRRIEDTGGKFIKIQERLSARRVADYRRKAYFAVYLGVP